MSLRISDLRSENEKLPEGSSVKVEQIGIDRYRVEIPKTGFKPKHIYISFFATFWVGFICLWTIGAASGSILFALFSIPFWLVGFLMIKGIIISVHREQELQIERDKLILIKTAPFFKKTLPINYSELLSIEAQSLNSNASPLKAYKQLGNGNISMNFFGMTPTITYSGKEETFGETISSAEQKWLVTYLNEKIVPIMQRSRV